MLIIYFSMDILMIDGDFDDYFTDPPFWDGGARMNHHKTSTVKVR